MKNHEQLDAPQALQALMEGKKLKDRFCIMWGNEAPEHFGDIRLRALISAQPFTIIDSPKEPELPEYIREWLSGYLDSPKQNFKEMSLHILRACDERIAKAIKDFAKQNELGEFAQWED